ncbi:MAG: stage V sporulation protein AB [Acetivibrio sp.]
MPIKYILLVVIGISGGFAVGGGIFAFITKIGVFPRLADRTNTVKNIKLYENAIIWGGTLGNLILIFEFHPKMGILGLVTYGIFSGIYVGCLAMSLAEVLDVIPVFAERVGIKYGMAWIILSIALGKGLGAFYQFL